MPYLDDARALLLVDAPGLLLVRHGPLEPLPLRLRGTELFCLGIQGSFSGLEGTRSE